MRIFKKYFSLIIPAFVLGSCAYTVDSSNQDITFMTPGANDAVCYAYVDGLKYKLHPPQTRNITKHHKAMTVECFAPGNRYVEIDVEPEMSKRALWGTPAGMAWDLASRSLYYYPSVVAIDFSQEMLKHNKMPQHNNSDIRQPEGYDLEEFESGSPLLNSDRNKADTPLKRRGDVYTDEQVEEMEKAEEVIEMSTDSKGDLKSVIDDLTAPDADESTADQGSSATSDEAHSEPISIYPGQ